jgi:hypothetical protein
LDQFLNGGFLAGLELEDAAKPRSRKQKAKGREQMAAGGGDGGGSKTRLKAKG